jgi:hypothetical protein
MLLRSPKMIKTMFKCLRLTSTMFKHAIIVGYFATKECFDVSQCVPNMLFLAWHCWAYKGKTRVLNKSSF